MTRVAVLSKLIYGEKLFNLSSRHDEISAATQNN